MGQQCSDNDDCFGYGTVANGCMWFTSAQVDTPMDAQSGLWKSFRKIADAQPGSCDGTSTVCTSDPCANKPYRCMQDCPGFRSFGTQCVSVCPKSQAPKDKTGSTHADRICTICAAGKYADHTDHVCVASCPAGRQYILGRDCVSTPPSESEDL